MTPPPDIVSGGLGGDGPVVTAGLGLTAAPDPNALRATITASGALQATLSAAGGNALTATLAGTSSLTTALTDANAPEVPAGKPGGRQFWGASLTPPRQPLPRPIPGVLSAHLAGGSTLIADLDFTIDFDDELEQLLMLGIV
jgi:hypothetical protein